MLARAALDEVTAERSLQASLARSEQRLRPWFARLPRLLAPASLRFPAEFKAPPAPRLLQWAPRVAAVAASLLFCALVGQWVVRDATLSTGLAAEGARLSSRPVVPVRVVHVDRARADELPRALAPAALRDGP